MGGEDGTTVIFFLLIMLKKTLLPKNFKPQTHTNKVIHHNFPTKGGGVFAIIFTIYSLEQKLRRSNPWPAPGQERSVVDQPVFPVEQMTVEIAGVKV